jgi:hypothetical protein
MAGAEYFNVREEFADVDFHDARLEKRFIRTSEGIQPGGSEGHPSYQGAAEEPSDNGERKQPMDGTCIS